MVYKNDQTSPSPNQEERDSKKEELRGLWLKLWIDDIDREFIKSIIREVKIEMVYKGVTKEDGERCIRKMKEIMEKVGKDGDEARAFLYRAGINNKDGTLNENYREKE